MRDTIVTYGYLKRPPWARLGNSLFKAGKYLCFGLGLFMWPHISEFARNLAWFGGFTAILLAISAACRRGDWEIVLLQPFLGVLLALGVLQAPASAPLYSELLVCGIALAAADRLTVLFKLRRVVSG